MENPGLNKMHDVVIVGAGPGGSAMAYFLAQQGVDVLLLDKADFPRDKTCGDGLTPRALAVLEQMGLLAKVMAAGFVMREATVFSPKGRTVTTEIPQSLKAPPYMVAVPRLILDNMLLQHAITAGALFQSRVHVQDIEQVKGGVLVQGQRDKRPYSVRARLAVIAIGASMKLLLTLGILKEQPQLILAARAYHEQMQGVNGRFEFHFDGIPLPGYGWVFPLSDSSANVGAGILQEKRKGKRGVTSQSVLKQFLQLPMMQHMLEPAHRVGPVKGYPLRTDFATAPTYGERTLLIGEAAGLVNPLTGEGIDYALESAHIAAQHVLESFGDFSPQNLADYDQKLRQEFQRTFIFMARIRDWYLNKPILNRIIHVANRRDELRELFTNIVLGNADAATGFSPKTMMQIAFTW